MAASGAPRTLNTSEPSSGSNRRGLYTEGSASSDPMPYKVSNLHCAHCDHEFVGRRLKKNRARFCSRRCAGLAKHLEVPLERIWANVNYDGPVVNPDLGSCWLWLGATIPLGYGYLSVAGRRGVMVHRIAYELAYGQISDGLVIDHLCCTPRCLNPWHLEAVTQAENVRRARHRGLCLRSLHILARGSGYCRPCRRTWLTQRAA